ncbi:MAG: hypothetical protein M3Y37_09145, partial [Chloroflexota bacterium]|nr:hypothetical protein [Chloroflexota bacterium]
MPVSHSFNRRLLVAGGLASAGAAILANNQRKDASDARFGGGGILSHSRDPLQIAFLDRHAFRLEPLIPELEIAIGRRIMVEALSFDQLYANFTIDLLQQTGRYDIVSICESWFPYFGRAGYFSDLEPPEGAGNRIFPARFVEAARGIDGTDLLAHPWTFDFVMSAFGPDNTHKSWTDYLRWIDARPEHRVLVPLQRGDVAADSFRAMSLTYGQDVVDVVTQLPGLNRYGSARALMTLANLAARAGHDRVFGTTWDTVAQRATNREIDDAPLILASDMAGPLSSGWHGQRLPVG